MSKVVNIDLPFFMGFYESAYENSDTGYELLQDEIDFRREEEGKEYTEDDFEFDYDSRRKDIVDKFVETFMRYVPLCVKGVSHPVLDSPKYYNFRTDRIYADVELADGWEDAFKEFIGYSRVMLDERIHDDWSTRDGFLSFIDNNLEDFEKHLFDEGDKQQDTYIGIMLGYIMEAMYDAKREGPYSDDLEWVIAIEVLEDIVDFEYLHLKQEDK